MPLATKPDISICVAVYKRHRKPNLSSLAASITEALGRLRGELIIVLNGIEPQDADVPSGAEAISFEVNRGVPVAWNVAARVAKGPVLCFVNDDVVLGAQSLEVLYRALDSDPTAGVVGPVGTRWDISRARHVSYVDLAGVARGEMRQCEVVSGFLFATPKRAFERVGGFEEAYSPCGFEEVDYCTAVRRRAGLRCFAVAGVEFKHRFAISAARSWRRIRYDGASETIGSIARRNRAYFLAKWSATGEEPVSLQRGRQG
jgi:GT2 family glycosyltransferase